MTLRLVAFAWFWTGNKKKYIFIFAMRRPYKQQIQIRLKGIIQSNPKYAHYPQMGHIDETDFVTR